jgi:hypothetical protein
MTPLEIAEEIGVPLDDIEEACKRRFELCPSCESKRRELCIVSLVDSDLCETCLNNRKAHYAMRVELGRCALALKSLSGQSEYADCLREADALVGKKDYAGAVYALGNLLSHLSFKMREDRDHNAELIKQAAGVAKKMLNVVGGKDGEP